MRGPGAFEEALFTGLRLVEGVSLHALREEFAGMVDGMDFRLDGLVEKVGDRVRLTLAGRMVSNEVFGRLLEGGLRWLVEEGFTPMRPKRRVGRCVTTRATADSFGMT